MEQTRYRVVGGEASFGPADSHPITPDQPVRWTVRGIVWGDDGHGYPLVQPLVVEATPIGRGDRLNVSAHCQRLEALAYMVSLITAIGEQWPSAANTIWAHQPPKRCLGELRLKTSLADLGLAVADFTAAYRADGLTCVTVSEQREQAPSPDARRRRTWEITLQLPEPEQPGWCRYIPELSLILEARRMPGRYPVSMALTSQCHAFPEVGAFAGAFLALCRVTFRTTPVTGDSVTARPIPKVTVTGRADTPTTSVTDRPWEVIPDHNWDRHALRLWWEGLTCPEIGRRLSQAPKTVRNRLTLLRKEYGTDIVPTNRRRRLPTSEVGTPG